MRKFWAAVAVMALGAPVFGATSQDVAVIQGDTVANVTKQVAADVPAATELVAALQSTTTLSTEARQFIVDLYQGPSGSGSTTQAAIMERYNQATESTPNATASASLDGALNVATAVMGQQSTNSTTLLASRSNTSAFDAPAGPAMAAAPKAREQEMVAWGKGFGFWSDKDTDGSNVGYEADAYGMIVGLDLPVGEMFVIGGNFSYMDTDVDIDKSMGDMDSDTYTIGLSGAYAQERLFVTGQLNYSWGDTDGQRDVPLLRHSNDYDYDFDTWQVGMGVGYVFKPAAELRLIPQADVAYFWYNRDEYNENGSNSRMSFDEYDAGTFQSKLGMALNRTWTVSGVKLTPEARAFWRYRNTSDEDIDMKSLTIPNLKLSIDNAENSQHYGIIGTGLTVGWTENISTGLTYDFEFADDYMSHLGQISLSVSF